MNLSLRLCTLVLLIFGCTLRVQAVITPEEIRSLATKIEQGAKLNEDEIRKLSILNKKHPGLLTENMLKQLKSSGKLRTSQNGSSKKGAFARRKNTARKLRNIIIEQSQEKAVLNKENLVSIIAQLTEDLEQADYAHLNDMVQKCITKINDLGINLDIPHDTASALKTALEYGIADVVECLIRAGVLITQGDITYLAEIQVETETEDSDIDCAWFKSGADFEQCRQLLEAALID